MCGVENNAKATQRCAVCVLTMQIAISQIVDQRRVRTSRWWPCGKVVRILNSSIQWGQ